MITPIKYKMSLCDFEGKNTFIVGRTGSGKTYLITQGDLSFLSNGTFNIIDNYDSSKHHLITRGNSVVCCESMSEIPPEEIESNLVHMGLNYSYTMN